MEYRFAATADIPTLAVMNQQLIQDEGHRSQLTLPELEQRMSGWLAGGYRAVIFSRGGIDVGYALYCREPEWVYLRQFFVGREHRRQGLGRRALQWLLANPWKDAPRIRMDVLMSNPAGIAFWRAVGFADYCITMELEETPSQSIR